MTKIEPSTLDIAKATLLAPFGIDEAATQRVFGTILAHKADDADLYFQYNRSEGHARHGRTWRRCLCGHFDRARGSCPVRADRSRGAVRRRAEGEDPRGA